MDYVNSVIAFITDENRRLSTKAAFVIIIIATVFIVDNLMGFSFHYQKEKEITEIEKLNGILKDHSNDSTCMAYTAILRNEIMSRRNFAERIYSFFKNISSNNDTAAKDNPPTANAKNNDVSIKSSFWTYASSGGIYFVLTIVCLPIFFLTDRKNKLIVVAATTIATASSMFIFGMFLTWFFSLIPQISSKTWLWNYILNLLFQITILSALLYFAIKKSKNK